MRGTPGSSACRSGSLGSNSRSCSLIITWTRSIWKAAIRRQSSKRRLQTPAGLGRLLLLTQVPIGSPAIARSMFPFFLEVEHQDRQLVLQAHADGRHVHDLELVAHHLIEGQGLVQDGVRVFFGVGRIDAVDSRGLEQHVDAELLAAQGGGRVGGDKRAPVPVARMTTRPRSRWEGPGGG